MKCHQRSVLFISFFLQIGIIVFYILFQISNKSDDKVLKTREPMTKIKAILQPHHYLVCPKPEGRLGNMMFEFAASVGIANTLRYKHIIKPSHTLMKYFDIKQVLNIKIGKEFTNGNRETVEK